MTYEIRTYSEDFLETQVEIGRKVMVGWLGTLQTNVEQLKKAYSKDHFDPDTRHYAFKDGKMVGFLTSEFRSKDDPRYENEISTARLEFPILLPGHEEAGELLLEKAYKVLKEKGAEKIQTRASPLWGNTLELIEKYGYGEEYVISKHAKIPFDQLGFSSDSKVELRDYIPDEDDAAILSFYTDKVGIPEQQIQGQLNFFKSTDNLVSWQLVMEEGEIITTSIAFILPFDRSQVGFTIPPFIKGQEVYVRAIYARHLQKVREREGITHINSRLLPDQMDAEPLLTSLGFSFNTLAMYSKKL